jgi:hypothetical protein
MMIGLVGSSSSCGTLWPFLEDLCADAATSSKDFTSEAHHLIFQTPVWGKLCVATLNMFSDQHIDSQIRT